MIGTNRSRIELLDGRVSKRLSRLHLRSEAALTRAAHAASLESGFYYVPRVLDADEERGVLVLEFLPDATPLSAWLGSDREMEMLLLAARALAHAHDHVASHLHAVECTEAVAVHGDYNLTNVCYQSGTGRLLIFDWNVPPMFQRQGFFGPAEFDIACFLRALLLSPRRGISRQERAGRAAEFVEAYETARGRRLNRIMLESLLTKVVSRGARRQLGQLKLRSLGKSICLLHTLRREAQRGR
jgi:Putative homoserine kinase type II (protein kinase fold)